MLGEPGTVGCRHAQPKRHAQACGAPRSRSARTHVKAATRALSGRAARSTSGGLRWWVRRGRVRNISNASELAVGWTGWHAIRAQVRWHTHTECALGGRGMGSVCETHLHPVALLPGKSAVTVGEHKLCGGDDRPADATALSALWAGRRMVARRHARWTTAVWLCEERPNGWARRAFHFRPWQISGT